jgi:hypothetical protein
MLVQTKSYKIDVKKKHTWAVGKQFGQDNFELTKAVAASTFLKTIEPVVFCFFSLACSLSLSFDNTVIRSSNDLILDCNRGTSV